LQEQGAFLLGKEWTREKRRALPFEKGFVVRKPKKQARTSWREKSWFRGMERRKKERWVDEKGRPHKYGRDFDGPPKQFYRKRKKNCSIRSEGKGKENCNTMKKRGNSAKAEEKREELS